MKIGIIVGATFPVVGGTELASYKTARKLSERGHDVTIVTRFTQGLHPELMKQFVPMPEYEFDGYTAIYRTKSYPIKFGGSISHLIKGLTVFWRHPPDVILSFSMTKHSFVAMLLRYLLITTRLRSVPVVIWGRGSMVYEKAKRRGIRGFLIRRLLKFLFRAKRVIAHSPQMMLQFIKLGCKPTKITVIGNAIDLEEYKTARKPKRNHVVCVGSARKPKGLPYLVNAFTQLPEAKLTIVGGWGEQENYCKLIAKGHDNIDIVGMVTPEEVKTVLSYADVFCIPSLHESFPNVVLEAMAMGLPIISTNVGGLPWILEDTAIFVEPAKTVPLAQAIRQLLIDEAKMKELSKKSLERVKEFTWEKILPKLENVLEEAIN